MGDAYFLVTSHFPLVIILIGYIGNTIAFFIFTFNGKLKKLSSMRILSFLAVFDTIAISIWNLDHYLTPMHGLRLENLSDFCCKFLSFLQYSSLHISSFLHSLLCVDRYFTIISLPGSCTSRLPFGTARSAIAWSVGICIVMFCINTHLLFYTEIHALPDIKYIVNSTTNITSSINTTTYLCSTSTYYKLKEWHNLSNVILNNIAPCFIMILFNMLLIHKTVSTRKVHSTDRGSHANKRRLTVSLIIISFSYLAMTLPATILFGYFKDDLYQTMVGASILFSADFFLFFQHACIFIQCYLTNRIFREIVIQGVKNWMYRLICSRRRLSNAGSSVVTRTAGHTTKAN